MAVKPCARCEAKPAEHRWDVQLCADRRRKRAAWLCGKCDVTLNARTLAFLRIPDAAAKAKAYREARR